MYFWYIISAIVKTLSNRLWNLNTNGCNLQEPLHTLTSIKSYKTSDVIGYLRSVLENSKPYAREVFNSPVFHLNLCFRAAICGSC